MTFSIETADVYEDNTGKTHLMLLSCTGSVHNGLFPVILFTMFSYEMTINVFYISSAIWVLLCLQLMNESLRGEYCVSPSKGYGVICS